MAYQRRGNEALAWTRRAFLGAAFASSAAAPAWARQQAPQVPPYEPRDWSGQSPLPYPDPDLIALDRRFGRYILFNTPIKRLHIGTMWAEGPAWNGSGQYLVWSDIPNNVQHRWIQEDGRVTVFRRPSGHSNGNTFDREGRQLSCEHGGRRVARYEHNGDVTTIAERFDGKRLNSPNDAVVAPDGGIWFTDPPYGIRGDYEGFRAESETPPAVYRVDPQTGQVALVTDEPAGPNGLCFSPDYRRLYVADTGSGREIRVFDVDGPRLTNGRTFVELRAPGTGALVAADGIRCDVDGNVWAGAGDGVLVTAPDGDMIGAIRLPERCANLCFGGTRRNRLFMCASQSLYSVYVGVLGAGIA
ncbi:MAG TPA: gluconolactonase [Acidobacteria bacterium]|jgi:gluconolactonase|nr:gluconolactonase [Acidobacteriota bacterium]MEE2963554.1 SMP-30/gluconolactonase/LRE family protein [Acidobacteriota bacterium]HCE02868.1 gluconolactonase [Acidobacteriota bacterium]